MIKGIDKKEYKYFFPVGINNKESELLIILISLRFFRIKIIDIIIVIANSKILKLSENLVFKTLLKTYSSKYLKLLLQIWAIIEGIIELLLTVIYARTIPINVAGTNWSKLPWKIPNRIEEKIIAKLVPKGLVALRIKPLNIISSKIGPIKQI